MDTAVVKKHVEEALKACRTVETVCIVGENTGGCIDFRKAVERADEHFMRPTGEDALKTSEPMLIYFTSGTAGMPKMIPHDFSYPLGHIVTARYWQHARKGARHMVFADSGWAKFDWGKIYGQWICGAVTAAPDPVRGQVVKATIILYKSYRPSQTLKKEIQDHVKRVTAPYKYPRIVEFVEKLSKTASGEIRRVSIRERDRHKE